MATKVPQATWVFWLLKILATTLGETAGDAVTMSMDLGYLVGTAIFGALFLGLAAAQITVRRFHPFLFWAVIVATTTVGTTLADFTTRSLGVGYAGGSLILVALLGLSLAGWHHVCGSVSLGSVVDRRAEAFYWATVLCSQTLGTALGDWAADGETGLGLGYEGGALAFSAGLAIVGIAFWRTRVSHTLLFWTAFILTRPLGAMLGDLLDKPYAEGGLALSRYTASAVLAALILAGVVLVPQRAERRPVSAPR